ncbi:MAG: bifunctional riboflavin kinase/FAD synthetase [Bacteroidetes bacterium]|nr:bifunctional riboflavin kinase/FAD synthetase [Bacteroidota bacterium]
MKVVYDIKEFDPKKPVVLTQGTFDGVHFGHRKILRHVVSEAREIDGVSVLLTFYPHPRLVLYPDDNELKLLTTIEEKVELVSAIGIDYLIIIPFTQELSRLRASDFVRDILVEQLHISKLIIGYDHRFGRNREGGLKEMIQFSETYNFKLEEIPPQDIEDSIVSSTKIRKALLDGDVHLAKEYLGDLYTISGKVEEGLQRGTTIGYPTANVRVGSSFKLIPKNGVYAVWVYIDKIRYAGMLNIGYNPTFEDKKWSMEVHILNFNKNIYHHKILISFHSRIREEMKFEDVTSLVNQLTNDEKKIRSTLGI